MIELTQRHIVAWERAVKAAAGDDVTVSEWAGAIVQAAIDAGWYASPPFDGDLDDQPPAKIRQLADDIQAAYQDAVTVDPN